MKWKTPPPIKIYEALGAIGDERIIVTNNSAKVMSSSGNKSYDVEFDAESNAITANDNGSYWQGYLGYPAIAFLLSTKHIPYDPLFAEALRGIPWKDINTKYKNDFAKTTQYIHEILTEKQINIEKFLEEINTIAEELSKLNLNKLGPTAKPPEGY